MLSDLNGQVRLAPPHQRLIGVVMLAVLFAGSTTTLRAQKSISLVERTVMGQRISVLVPNDFMAMSDEMLKLKYPSDRRPTEVLTNEAGSINVAFNHTENPMAPNEVADAHPVLEQMFRNLYPSARWNRSELVRRGGRDFVLFDFWTPAVDTQVRNIMLCTSVQGRFLLAGFNVARELEEVWGPIAERIIDSVRVRD